ncbi:Dynein light chain 2 cytoplasmic [Scophthalmus maximus]|uniref:Dynein light chain n=1 Tax=Scophthalmus maximus TaxID=52904 RepID=A0A2U9BU34_SCOMX|nr:Dynein light chain 2 cytoplasmic [Scophthalmus maximus]
MNSPRTLIQANGSASWSQSLTATPTLLLCRADRGSCHHRSGRLFSRITNCKRETRRATMSDRKAVIKNADMSEDMQQDAVECATQALEKYNIEKDIAAYIKKVNNNFKKTKQ